jgi:hypothetical protein
VSSRRLPLIVMMQPTHFRDFLDQANIRPLDRPRHRTIHLQRPVCAPAMIIVEVPGQEPPEMSLVQDNHVVQAFAADAPDQPFDVGGLPWTPWGNQDFLDAHIADTPPERGAIDPVPIAQ